VLQEAKKRNPAIRTYGLSWGVPGWIGDGAGDGFGYFSEDNIRYHVDWLACAQTNGVRVDYMGEATGGSSRLAVRTCSRYERAPKSRHHAARHACPVLVPPTPVRPTGVWNERAYDSKWVQQLRRAMDAEGFHGTRIVAADGSWDVTADLLKDPGFAAAVDVVGSHYPGSAPPAAAVAGLNASWWASEMWYLWGVNNDWSGSG
jgi:hypothetical protein